MKEKRRLALAQKQVMLARLARRRAMGALADAIEEEDRGTQLAERSRELLANHAKREGAELACALAQHASYSRSLQDVANKAEQSRDEAREQAQWHREALAAAEARLNRSEDREKAAHKEVSVLQELRRQHELAGLARNLQHAIRTAGGS